MGPGFSIGRNNFGGHPPAHCKKTGDSRRAVDILKLIRQVAAAMRPYALQQLVVLVVVSHALQLCTGFVQALAISI